MQVMRFDNGGFVIHKIKLSGYLGHFSAWFKADGTYIDAEQIIRLGSPTRYVKDGGPAHRELCRLGRVWTDERKTSDNTISR